MGFQWYLNDARECCKVSAATALHNILSIECEVALQWGIESRVFCHLEKLEAVGNFKSKATGFYASSTVEWR